MEAKSVQEAVPVTSWSFTSLYVSFCSRCGIFYAAESVTRASADTLPPPPGHPLPSHDGLCLVRRWPRASQHQPFSPVKTQAVREVAAQMIPTGQAISDEPSMKPSDQRLTWYPFITVIHGRLGPVRG
jgi:hypothetical protein